MSTHSVIPPSSAAIWGAPNGCTGWPKMSAQFPQEETEDTREGNASHWLGEMFIQLGAAGQPLPAVNDGLVGRSAPNGVIISEEMFEAAMVYARDVLAEIRKHPGATWDTEARIQAPRIHPQSFGTTDAYLYVPGQRRLIVWDYKFGFKTVEAYMNWQGVNYVEGLFHKFSIDGLADQSLRVEIRVVQPRAFHRDGPIRSWAFVGSDIRAQINILASNAREALSEAAVTRSGDHCVYCTARHACPAALEGGFALYEAVNRPIPAELNPEQLGTQLSIVSRARKQLEYLESGYQEQITGLLRSGKSVPGWCLETGLGNRQWKRPVNEVLNFGDLLGVDLREPLNAVSPAKAEKRGVPPELVAAYVERKQTGVRLVPHSTDKARQIFAK